MSAATTRSRTPDRLCAEAVDLARVAAEEAAAPGKVGDHVSLTSEGDRVVTHFFACEEPGYRGWRWAVTVARASRAKNVTVDETVLLPGPDALLAPEWVPWSERLRPGDMGPGDLLPTAADDPRLEPGYIGEDTPPPNSAFAEPSHDLAERVDAEDAELTDRTPADEAVGGRGTIAALAEELGLRRARVLSRYGLRVAADRWDEAFGERSAMAQAAPASCATCGFLVPVAGSLRQAFGICANEYAPADGRVVSLSYGCGGHSEAAVMPKAPQPAPPVLDSLEPDAFPLHASPDEELGHS
ncbi:DUF3027 domain-containing protein [Streptomyces sp. NPDC000594]|uniref:DUF3027 domain-containing protein n=1 Tax=Streptomyces sp. NPDC000594 TaxID=3154261 RepID=UPI00332D6CC6